MQKRDRTTKKKQAMKQQTGRTSDVEKSWANDGCHPVPPTKYGVGISWGTWKGGTRRKKKKINRR